MIEIEWSIGKYSMFANMLSELVIIMVVVELSDLIIQVRGIIIINKSGKLDLT